MATYLVKLYCLLDVDKPVKLHPCVSLDIFIDDSHQSAQGPPEKMLKDTVMAGTTFVQASTCSRSRLPIPETTYWLVLRPAKTAVISSHRRVAVGAT